jgi:hypothetical protein
MQANFNSCLSNFLFFILEISCQKKKLKDSQRFFNFFYNIQKKSFESFNISKNNIISVEAVKVLGYIGLGNRREGASHWE